ncbi:MAG: hypothetical protein ACO388_10775 [Saprospiraceae bacterium]
MRLLALFILSSFFMNFNLIGQIPSSSVYLLQPSGVSSTSIEYEQPKYLTNYNPKGYNNHPFFIDDDRLIISSKLPDQAEPDLYELNTAAETLKKLTQTVSGEYSVALLPPANKLTFIRQENFEDETLIRVWEFPNDNFGPGKPLFPHLTNTGYHCWLNSDQVVLFIVEDQNRLVLTDREGLNFTTITEYPGRCFKILPNGRLIYFSDIPGEGPMLKIFNPNTNSRSSLIKPIGEVQDFEVVDEAIIMAKGKKIFISNWNLEAPEWKEFSNLEWIPGNQITRMAISNNGQLAIVME